MPSLYENVIVVIPLATGDIVIVLGFPLPGSLIVATDVLELDAVNVRGDLLPLNVTLG